MKYTLDKDKIAKAPTFKSSLSTPQWRDGGGSAIAGYLKSSKLAYKVTAINEYGETIASPELVVTVGSQLSPVTIERHRYIAGILPVGTYYYGVTAVNENGETNIVSAYVAENRGAPSPIWANTPSTVTNSGGQIASGSYFYAVSAVIEGKETLASTPTEVKVASDNSIVTINFLAVEGASSYRIYGRTKNLLQRIGEVSQAYSGEDQVISFVDNGSAIPRENLPVVNETTAGIEISWTPLEEGNVTNYKIYGRTSADINKSTLIATVGSGVSKYRDDGSSPETGIRPPQENTSGYSEGSGAEIRWTEVPGATGYRIYGRGVYDAHSQKEEKGYLVTVPATPTVWKDVGTASPDMTVKPPVADTTDGTLGVPGYVVPDGKTLEITPQGLLSVKGGIDSFLGRSNLHDLADMHVLVYEQKSQQWTNMNLKDLIFTLIGITEGTVVPLDPQFDSFKTELANKLALIESVNSRYNEFKTQVTELEDKVNYLKKMLGESFVPELDNSFNWERGEG